MPVVEDLVADCASIASVHIQFWDPSHHEKPDAHKTAMICETAYLGITLQDLPHRTKFCLAQQHDQLYLHSLDFPVSRWRIHITFKAYGVKLSWKRDSKVHRIRHHCHYSIFLFLDHEVTLIGILLLLPLNQCSKLTFSKSRLLATFNCKMVAIKKSVTKKKKILKQRTLHGILKTWRGGHFMTYYMKSSYTKWHFFNPSLCYSVLQVYPFMSSFGPTRGEMRKTGDAAACTID